MPPPTRLPPRFWVTFYLRQPIALGNGFVEAMRPGTTTAGPLPTLPARPVGNPGQAVPTHRTPHQRTLCLCGRTGRASGQQRRRAQPAPPGHQSQDQRRHPLGARHTEQDDAGLSLRHLARPGSKSSRRLPSTAHFPATLNCYPPTSPWHGYRTLHTAKSIGTKPTRLSPLPHIPSVDPGLRNHFPGQPMSGSTHVNPVTTQL